MPIKITAIICTHNPDPTRLRRTLLAIQGQSLRKDVWDCVIIDNGSSNPVLIHGERVRVICEPELGLTRARLRGVRETTAPFVVFVDDDNVLQSSYLEIALGMLEDNSNLGAIGGRVAPVWEGRLPPNWVEPFYDLLALRDFGDDLAIATATEPLSYPDFAPIGAGMAVRRSALAGWVEAVSQGRGAADRRGSMLTSSGDNDLVLHMLRSGWAVAYDPRLSLGHIIPEGRLSRDYLGRLAEGIMMSWVETLDRHGIRPWSPSSRWLTPWRLLRLYLTSRPWASEANYVRWRQRRGLILGRAKLKAASHNARSASLTLPGMT